MANQQHLDMLRKGVTEWNAWRREHYLVRPDLSGADLQDGALSNWSEGSHALREALRNGAAFRDPLFPGIDLRWANLSGANLKRADLRNAKLERADLRGAHLEEANLSLAQMPNADLSHASMHQIHLSGANLFEADMFHVDLTKADIRNANLRQAHLAGSCLEEADIHGANFDNAFLNRVNLRESNLSRVNLFQADVRDADLSGANLDMARFVQTDLRGANVTGCSVRGVTVDHVQLEQAIESTLLLTEPGEPIIAVDSLEIAPFVWMLLENASVSRLIEQMKTRIILILGNFDEHHQNHLAMLKEAIREQHYVSLYIDIETLARETQEHQKLKTTMRTLAYFSRIILVDITNGENLLTYLTELVSELTVPVQPLLEVSQEHKNTLMNREHLSEILPLYEYGSVADMQARLQQLQIG